MQACVGQGSVRSRHLAATEAEVLLLLLLLLVVVVVVGASSPRMASCRART